jgi:PD-(D/E)XK nuclease superfamily
VTTALDISSYLEREPQVREDWNLPIEHFSATSISMFKRCPEQFRQRYILGRKERPGEALVIGTAVHQAAAFNFEQKVTSHEDIPFLDLLTWYDDVGFTRAVEDRQQDGDEIIWDAGEDNARRRGRAITAAYHTAVAPRVQPLTVETRIEADFGLAVPVIGYSDVATADRVIDIKTGKAARRQVKPEWRLQAGIYSCITGLPVDFHAVSASVANHKVTILTPLEAPELSVWIPPDAQVEVERNVRSTAWLAQYLMKTLGPDEPWPTDGTAHPWACSWCGYRSGCPAWKGIE